MNRPRFTVVLATLVAGMVLGTVLPAAAQGPTFELSAGYQYTQGPDQSFPLGFAIDAARNWGTTGLVAEGGWAYDSETEFDLDANLNLWHLAAGPRWTGRRNPRVAPFVQVLAGWMHARMSVEVLDLDVSDSSNHFMVQPGGGVSIQAGDGWAFVTSVDYRRVFFSDEDGDDGEEEDGESGENQFRVFVGLRMLLD